jgi:hypothetical protein
MIAADASLGAGSGGIVIMPGKAKGSSLLLTIVS